MMKAIILVVMSLLLVAKSMNAELSSSFYATTCPKLEKTVRTGIKEALGKDSRMGAAILRLFFHDCFVNGCDASILLVDTSSFIGEQNALPNENSLKGYGVIDDIKTQVEKACPGVVSCADILAIAARESVSQLGGPTWSVPLGRRDARNTSKADAERNLPTPFSDLATLTRLFAGKGLSATEMTALTGGHTLGAAQCFLFRDRIRNASANIDPAFASKLRRSCPSTGGDTNLTALDDTPDSFDNAYFQNLVARRGVLSTDQLLFNNGSQDALVRTYSSNSTTFFRDFANAMVKLGNISPLTGSDGEIRRACQRVNV